jgi:hypothetical protein
MMQKPPRPTGIAILAILDFIGGVLLLLGGAFLAAIGGSSILTTYGYGAFSGVVTVFGGIAVVLGLFAIFVGWGLWSGKSWAWTLAVVLYILGALTSLVGLAGGSLGSIVPLILYALILWYLWKPHVKAYFGKGMAQTAPTVQAPPAPTQ